jgi:hypothetical protein
MVLEGKHDAEDRDPKSLLGRNERICDLFASVDWTNEDKECPAGNNKAERSGCGIIFIILGRNKLAWC